MEEVKPLSASASKDAHSPAKLGYANEIVKMITSSCKITVKSDVTCEIITESYLLRAKTKTTINRLSRTLPCCRS